MVDIWIGSFYRIVNSLGFPDPIHVTLVHLPMGLIIGAFCFAWISALSSWKKPAVTAYNCITLALYSLCFLTIIGLGWFGARLVYGEQIQASSKKYQGGEKIFSANCNICHANGGNKFSPDNPLRNSEALQNFNDFLALIRHPEKPMPAFTAFKISDKDSQELYAYIVNEVDCPKGAGRDSQ